MIAANTGYLIHTYSEKNVIVDDFKLLKDNTITCFRPIRHWTDSKIRDGFTPSKSFGRMMQHSDPTGCNRSAFFSGDLTSFSGKAII